LAEKVLGPNNLRSSEEPKAHPSGGFTGGTAFERSHRARQFKEAARCYTTAYSYQKPMKIASVTAGSKRTGEDMENLALRTNVNLVRYFLSCFQSSTDFPIDRPNHRSRILPEDGTSGVLRCCSTIWGYAKHSECGRNPSTFLLKRTSEHIAGVCGWRL
jgi:hypothetical protein